MAEFDESSARKIREARVRIALREYDQAEAVIMRMHPAAIPSSTPWIILRETHSPDGADPRGALHSANERSATRRTDDS